MNKFISLLNKLLFRLHIKISLDIKKGRLLIDIKVNE